LGGALALAAWMAASLVWFVGPVAAKTCGGGGHTISLTAGGVSPGSGTTATNFKFTVTFTDSLGQAPGSVSLRFNRTNYAMAGSGSGTVYSLTRTMPLGTTAFTFRATSSTGGISCTRAEPGSVTVTAVPTPTPTPVPTPKPTPVPTPTPTPVPTPKPTPVPTLKPTPVPTPKPTPVPTPKPTLKPTPVPTPKPTANPTTRPTATPTVKPIATARPTAKPTPKTTARTTVKPVTTAEPSSTSDTIVVSPAPTPTDRPLTAAAGQTTGGQGGTGGVSASSGRPNLGGGPSPSPMIAVLVTTLGGLLLLFVFMRRRRRPGDVVAGDLALATASSAPAAALAPTPAISPLVAAKPKSVAPKGASTKAAAAKAAAAKAATKGNERYQVGYQSVRLGDGPDDLRSTELGRLDRGDEVEILGSHEGFLQVRTTAGMTGWIPRHTITGSPISAS